MQNNHTENRDKHKRKSKTWGNVNNRTGSWKSAIKICMWDSHGAGEGERIVQTYLLCASERNVTGLIRLLQLIGPYWSCDLHVSVAAVLRGQALFTELLLLLPHDDGSVGNFMSKTKQGTPSSLHYCSMFLHLPSHYCTYDLLLTSWLI